MRIGIDIVENDRMSCALEKSGNAFFERVISENERPHIDCHDVERFAGVWAAKEAAVKALGTGFRHGITFHDIEIHHDTWGRPYYVFGGVFKDILLQDALHNAVLSISHCKTHAVAVAVLSS